MKVITNENIIKVIGANFAFMLPLMVVVVIIAPAGFIVSLIIIYIDTNTFIKVFAAWPLLITMPAVLFLTVRETFRARRACTLINRNDCSVILEGSSYKVIFEIGTFTKILIQPVSTSNSGMHFQAYLLGVSGKCPLGVQAYSRHRLTKIFKPISRSLEIPLEYTQQSIGIGEVMAIRRGKSVS